MHEHIAPAYGLALSPEQHAQAHLRPVEKILETIARTGQAAAAVARPAGERMVGVCRHFTLLHVAMLRPKAWRHGPAAASAPISRRASSSTIG